MPSEESTNLVTAYYNEIDPFAAQWLRNLIAAGRIAPGIVDTRSIEDVSPSELRGFTQCHFFAGIAVWSHALRNAGWSDDRPVWTGSCPCQPFSAAGHGTGFADERHLWPAFHYLIQECSPPVVLGEQVASKNAEPWIDLVCDDLEALGYAFGAIPFPAAGVGAPHIRDRLYWVADASGERREWRQRPAHRGFAHGDDAGRIESHDGLARPGEAGLRLADTHGDRCPALPELGKHCAEHHAESRGAAGGLADTIMQQRPDGQSGICNVDDASGRVESAAAPTGLCGDLRPGPTNSFWRDADWLLCRDGRWRPVEPGTSPLAHGVAQRVGRLRAYGNAIVAPQAQAFIESVMDSL